MQVDRPLGLPEVGVADAEVAQGAGFACPVAGLPGDGQRLLVQVDRPLGLPEVGVADAEVAQGGGFAVPGRRSPGRWSGLARRGRWPGGSRRAGSGSVPRLPRLAARVRGVGEVVVQAGVQVDGVAVVAPWDEVVEVDGEQDLGGGVVVAALVAQFELGQLGGEVVEGFPLLRAGFADLGEVVGAAVPQRGAGERRRVGVPVDGLAVAGCGPGRSRGRPGAGSSGRRRGARTACSPTGPVPGRR